jgi:hypothetical protein
MDFSTHAQPKNTMPQELQQGNSSAFFEIIADRPWQNTATQVIY